MTALPFEILLLIFKELNLEDLTHCQLVSKLWNQASLKQLYSVITINTEEKSRLYVRTIKNSPNLGKQLEVIDTGLIFQKKENPTIWDTHGLFDTILNHCPNLLRLLHYTTSSPFWMKLMYAASQSRLSRLQFISCPRSSDYDYYVYTALCFKNTLSTLELPNLENDVPNLLDSEAYPTLRNSLNKFSCLQTLIVNYVSDQPISRYDALIDSCKNLKKLVINTSSYDENEYEIHIPPGPSICPRPDIHTLQSKWELIYEDDQLNYFMQKFSNLKSLTVHVNETESEYIERDSPNVLIQFLRFLTTIPKVNLSLVLGEEECMKVWTDIINEKHKNIEITIYVSIPSTYIHPLVTVNRKNHCQLSLKMLPSEEFRPLYTTLLSDTGENIQHLILEVFDSSLAVGHGFFNNIQNIIDSIQLCPSLEHLELRNINDLPFSDNNLIYRHFNVKSLTLCLCAFQHYIGTFKNMSLIFPNLKEFCLCHNDLRYGKSEATTIAMPYSSLDILKWDFSEIPENVVNNPDIYIRLNVNSVESFYIVCEDEIMLIGSKQYNHPRPYNLYLDITCQNLIKLQINKFIYTF